MRPSAPNVGALLGQVQECDAEAQAIELSLPAPWDPCRFRHVRVLQEAARNHGRVELVEDLLHNRLVAVKAMPLWWACNSHVEFVAAHPRQTEHPWLDIAVAEYLCRVRGVASVCEPVGVFRRGASAEGQEEELCFAMTYCPAGDLLAWLGRSAGTAEPPELREQGARPILRSLFAAVLEMHRAGIAHGDLSLENVLLEDESGHEIRLIDFAQATGPRAHGPRGKRSYQAPEVHEARKHDAFSADVFALGVIVFTMLIGNYPWEATRPQLCPSFRLFRAQGLDAFLAQRTLRRGGKITPLSAVLSKGARDLLSGLLALQPGSRLTVADALQHPWLTDEGCPQQRPAGARRRTESCFHGVVAALWPSKAALSA